jgi:hypothetical protein
MRFGLELEGIYQTGRLRIWGRSSPALHRGVQVIGIVRAAVPNLRRD